MLALFFSASSFASYHFQCHKKLNKSLFEALPSTLLIPNLADLTSGAGLVSIDQTAPDLDFSYVKTTSSSQSKGKIIMRGDQNLTLQIQSTGVVRKMTLSKINDGKRVIEATYKCFIESSI
jgi:hypothetical protein